MILKRVTSIRQLRKIEKELVRLCYKEATLRGFSLVNHIQCYIASKTKIWIDRSGIEYLKKSEEEDDKKWYFNLARDQFAYVGVYRRTIDEIEQYKKLLWSIMAEPEATNMEKVYITKELHNLTKTHTLLLRDLPFVTKLSKYYDHALINTNFHHQSSSHNTVENKVEKEIIEQKASERLRKLVDESGLFNSGQKPKMGFKAPADCEDKNTDKVMEDMRAQLTDNDHIEKMLDSKEYRESIKKLKEIMED